MSYSFTFRAANKSAARARVAEELAKVVAAQPVHAADQAAAQATADAIIGILPDDETKEVSVSVAGYLVWQSPVAAGPVFTGANVSVGASLETVPEAKQ